MSAHKNRPFRERLGFALNGIGHAIRNERSFRVQLLATGFVIIVLLVLRPTPLWCAVLLLATAGVLVTELLNSALEHLADRLHPESDPDIAVAKDCAAGAVLIASIFAVAAFAAFFWDHFRGV